MHDFSWYPRQTYLYHGQEVIRVDADIHSYFMGTVYDYKVTYFYGRVKRGEAQRNDFSGFLKSHNMLPAWAEEQKGPIELAEQWGFVRVEPPEFQRPLTGEDREHVCYVPKETPDPTAELQGPQPGVKVFSLQISSALDRTYGSPVVMTATGMNGAAYEVPYHGLETRVDSVALALKRQLSLPEWLNIKLITHSGEPLQEADMLFSALEASHTAAVSQCAESSETAAQAERVIACLYQRIGQRDDLSPSLQQELWLVALAEARHNDPEVEQFLHMLASHAVSSQIHEGVYRQLAEVEAHVDKLKNEMELQASSQPQIYQNMWQDTSLDSYTSAQTDF